MTPFTRLGIVAATWGAAGIVALRIAPPQIGAGIVAILAILLFAGGRTVPALRRPLDAVPAQAMLAAHLVRAAAVSLLIVRGHPVDIDDPSARFAIGEIAVALLAAGILWLLSMPLGRRPRSAIVWNLFGLVNGAWGLVLWAGSQPGDPHAGLTVAYLGAVLPIALATHLEMLGKNRSLSV